MHTPREQALLLGRRKSLVTVLTESVEPMPPDRPAVVILNSGIIHRVGANRMTVKLARALAAAGHTAVRFDLSGIGDSDPRPDTSSMLESALADTKEVLDSLESMRGFRRVILCGLCSGADASLLGAQAERRVVGAILLDPSIPRTLRHEFLHYRRRLLRLESWLNVARGKNPLWRFVKARVSGDEHLPTIGPRPHLQDPAVRGFLAAAYARALENGVQFLAVLTGERSYYREQLLEAFPGVPFGDRLRLEHFEGSDHMFSAQVDCSRVIRIIVEWTTRTTFAGGVPRPAVCPDSSGRTLG